MNRIKAVNDLLRSRLSVKATAYALAVILVYFFAARLGLLLATLNRTASPVWPASGVAIAALALNGLHNWPVIWIGAFLANVSTGTGLFISTFIAIGNCLEALVGAWIIGKLKARRAQFEFLSDGVAIGTAAILGPSVSATIGTIALTIGQVSPAEMMTSVWVTWWTGDVLGTLILTPVFLALRDLEWPTRSQLLPQLGRTVLILCATLAIAGFALWDTYGNSISIAVFLSLLIGAYLLNSFGLRLLIFGIATVGVIVTVMGHGPFADGTLNENLLHLQLFLTALGLTGLFLEGFRRANQFWMPTITLLVGWFATGALHFNFDRQDRARDKVHLNSLISEATHEIGEGMHSHEDALRTGAAFLRENPNASIASWSRFASFLRLGHRFGGKLGVGVIWPIQQSHLNDFQSTQRKVIGADFQIHPFPGTETVQGQPDDEHPIITMFEPLTNNTQSLGLDLSAEPKRREALDLARRTGLAALTQRVTLAYDNKAEPGFVLVHPIIQSSNRFLGWTFTPFLARDFFKEVPGRFWSEIQFFVFDDQSLSPGSLLFRSDLSEGPLPKFNHISRINLAQRDLFIGWRPSPGFISSHDGNSAWVGFAGALLSLLLASVLVGLREINQRAILIAGEKTRLLSDREKSLQQVREQFALAIRGSNDGLWDWNILTNEVYFSPRWKEMLGYTENELENKFSTWSQLIHPEDRDLAIGTIESYLKGNGSQYRLEHRLRHKDGHYRWILARGMALWDQKGEPYRMAGSHTDITAAKETEVTLIKARESAVAGAQAKSEFLANMSHEIRTPLSGVIGVAALLDETELNEQQREYTDTIRQSAESLLLIINDILDFSKIEAGKLTIEKVSFDIKAKIKRIYHLMRFNAEQKGLQIVTEVPEDLNPHFVGDPTRLRQILVNLISNAIKFSFKGQIRLALTVLEESPKAAKLRFSVQDQGIGIPAEMHNEIFQPFSQGDTSTSREYGGTGLGLSICKNLVQLMHGEIGVESEMGVGSLFWFEITLARPTIEQIEIRQLSTRIDFKPIQAKVLLVEDNRVNLRVASAMLKKFGLEVLTATNGREAVASLQRELVDLVFMDCQMPELDGYQATEQIRQQSEPKIRQIPIIAMTANSLKGDRDRCLRAGMNDYLAKPVQPEDLYEMICKWLGNTPEPSSHGLDSDASVPANVLDLATLRTLSSLTLPGEPNVLERVVEVYLQTYPENLSAIELAAQNQHWNEVRREAHGLKAASGGVGLQRVAYLCQQIEEHAMLSPMQVSDLIEKLKADLELGDQRLREALTAISTLS